MLSFVFIFCSINYLLLKTFFLQASTKKNMIKEGLLDKYGKPNENTPENWRQTFYKDVYVLNINYIQGL